MLAFLTDLPAREPQIIIDMLIRKVVLFDDRIEIHYNFIDKPEPDEPDGTSPEDRRVIPFSFQSSLKSCVPPSQNNPNLLVTTDWFGFVLWQK